MRVKFKSSQPWLAESTSTPLRVRQLNHMRALIAGDRSPALKRYKGLQLLALRTLLGGLDDISQLGSSR